MKNISFILLISLLVAGCQTLFNPEDKTQAVISEAEKEADRLRDQTLIKKKILVFRFLNKSRHGGEELAEIATVKTRDFLLNYQKDFAFSSIEETGGSESFLDAVGDYDLRAIFKKARSLGMNGVLLGTIQELSIGESNEDTGLFRSKLYSVQSNVRLQLFDVTNEKELLNQTSEAEVSEEHLEYFRTKSATTYDPERGHLSVVKAFEKILPLVPRYGQKIAWTGRVAKIDANRIYITAGEMSGIPKGQLLKVYGDSVPVYEPDSNRYLGSAPGRFKGLLRIIEHFGNDGSVAVIHSGGGFKEKDRVELFSSISH